MGKATWVRYKDGGGPRVRGTNVYNSPQPWGPWTKVMGVVARCEGAHDTVVMYDETGVTWGFMQWTFTSGRLQKLLESLKSIPYYDFENESNHNTLFDVVCCEDSAEKTQVFERFGFRITGGKFVDLAKGRALNMTNRAQRKRCVDVCMGRVAYPGNVKKQRTHVLALANVFAKMGQEFGVADAQIQFAKQEFKRQMKYKRKPLGGLSIEWLIDMGSWYVNAEAGEDLKAWEVPFAALFFTCWQNNPGAAYRLFLKTRRIMVAKDNVTASDCFQVAWKLLNRSKFGNWGFGKPQNKSPRVVRIKKAIQEFYPEADVDLRYYK